MDPDSPTSTSLGLSIIIPVYNEVTTIARIIDLVRDTQFPYPIEIVVVDDGSTDGTLNILKKYSEICTVIRQEKNQGKGSAIREGLQHVSYTYTVIQDADLEYDPADLAMMHVKMVEEHLPVLYGSRSILRGRNNEAGWMFYWGGQLITLVTNILYNQRLTDEPTCYKMFETELLRSLPLRCRRFEFCPEVTAHIARRGYLIPEVHISYYPRDVRAGKKIKWHDGIHALYTLLRCRL